MHEVKGSDWMSHFTTNNTQSLGIFSLDHMGPVSRLDIIIGSLLELYEFHKT